MIENKEFVESSTTPSELSNNLRKSLDRADKAIFPTDIPYDFNAAARIWMIHKNNRLVGYAAIETYEPTQAYFLSRIGVRSKYRQLGLGSRLLYQRVNWVKNETDVDRIITYVSMYNIASMCNLIKQNFLPYYTTEEGFIWLESQKVR